MAQETSNKNVDSGEDIREDGRKRHQEGWVKATLNVGDQAFIATGRKDPLLQQAGTHTGWHLSTLQPLSTISAEQDDRENWSILRLINAY